MATELRALPRERAGFTLVEVLVAMIILAIGLLALESMAIGAARRVAVANATTEYTLLATQELESTLEQVRRNQNPGSAQWDLDNGTGVLRTVTTTLVAGAVPGTVFDVQVTVTPPTGGSTLLQPVTVTGRVFN